MSPISSTAACGCHPPPRRPCSYHRILLRSRNPHRPSADHDLGTAPLPDSVHTPPRRRRAERLLQLGCGRVGVDRADRGSDRLRRSAGANRHQLPRGTPWFSKGCSLTTLASGALRIDLADLDANEGATVSASLGSGVIPALPSAPSGAAEDPGSGVVAPALIAVLAALAGGRRDDPGPPSRSRAVWSGGAADAAFGESEDGLGPA